MTNRPTIFAIIGAKQIFQCQNIRTFIIRTLNLNDENCICIFFYLLFLIVSKTFRSYGEHERASVRENVRVVEKKKKKKPLKSKSNVCSISTETAFLAHCHKYDTYLELFKWP